MAGRLSEQADWRVLLLEAGGEEPTTSAIPAFAVSALGTDLDWRFKTEPQKGACLSTKGVCGWPRGKMMGGTGAMTGKRFIQSVHKPTSPYKYFVWLLFVRLFSFL